MTAHPVMQVIGEQALVDILDLSKVAWTCWGCSYTQQWAGAEDGERIRPAAGHGILRGDKLAPCLCMICTGGVSAVGILDRPNVEPVLFNFVRSFPFHVEHPWRGL